MFKEFRAFIARGNVIDLAVAVVIGAAFGKIVTSLVEGIVMPPIGLFTGGIDFASLFVVLDSSKGVPASLAEAKAKGIPVVAYGQFIIDMLMSGLTIPDQSLKQPLLLGQFTNVFGQRIRYSSDADAMDASATNGLTGGALNLRVPRLSTGGVVMLVAEITPEQLFERTQDTLLHTTSVDTLPEYLRDELDPEKVEVVRNDYIDTAHATPAGTFGYGPLNHKFHKRQYNVGGKFYRPSTDGTADEVRQRIWSVEVANPTLSADFYLCTTMNQKPFLDTVADPFEAVAIGDFAIEGNTVFGGVLVEAMNNYDAVMEKAPVDRIEKP